MLFNGGEPIEALLIDTMAHDGGFVAAEMIHVDDAQVFVELSSGNTSQLLTLNHRDALDLAARLAAAVRSSLAPLED